MKELSYFFGSYKIICCEINKTKIKIEDLGTNLPQPLPPPPLPITSPNYDFEHWHGYFGCQDFCDKSARIPPKNESTCLKISHSPMISIYLLVLIDTPPSHAPPPPPKKSR